jgi:Putative zinc-finger
MNVDLGGPGALCSSHRMRLFLLGELPAREMEQMRQHSATCERCEAVRRETERERADLETAMPFDALAAGVAERLARASNPAPRARRRPHWAKIAAVAGAAVAAAAAIAIVPFWDAGDGGSIRTKGGAGFTLYAKHGQETLALDKAAPVRKGDQLLVSLSPGGKAWAAVLFVEGAEVSVIWQGRASPGPLPKAFEWTGEAKEAQLYVAYGSVPLDVDRLSAQAARGELRPGAEVIFRRLERAR